MSDEEKKPALDHLDKQILFALVLMAVGRLFGTSEVVRDDRPALVLVASGPGALRYVLGSAVALLAVLLRRDLRVDPRPDRP